jgi:hypothetical protein
MLKLKTDVMFIQAAIGKVDTKVWIDVYTLVFIASSRELELQTYKILYNVIAHPPNILEIIHDTKLLPECHRTVFLQFCSIMGHYFPKDLRLRLYCESLNINSENSHRVLFDSFSYLEKFWIQKQTNDNNTTIYFWGTDLVRKLQLM